MSDYIEFLDGKKFPAKNAARSPQHESFKDAGYCLTDQDLIIDVDNLEKDVIEKMIQFFNIKTQIVWTTRGAHFYYKKPNGFKGNKGICALGFEVEYKHKKNTDHIAIKQNGKLREIENAGIREDLPDLFKHKRNLTSLMGLDEGEGRNDALFKHKMRIQNFPQWKSMMAFINRNILAAPLDDKEFQVITRESSTPKAAKNNFQELAEYLISKYRIVSYFDQCYWRINNEYTADQGMINRLIAAELPDAINANFYENIKKLLDYKAPIIEADKIFDIKLQNGILRNGRFMKCDYQDFTPYTIDLLYDPKAEKVDLVDEYLDHLSMGDESYKQRILEVMAFSLITDPNFKGMLCKIFIIIGGGGNGKGTFLKIINTILGEKNCSYLSIKQMADERYFYQMLGKLCNLGDDLDDEYVKKDEVKILKNISSCDFIMGRKLHEMAKQIRLTASLIFASNHLLKSQEKGDSWKRRLDWMPIDRKPEKADPEFFSKVTSPQALQYWMRLMIEAYQRLYKEKKLTPCKIVDDFNAEYHLFNDNIHQFFQDVGKDGHRRNTAKYWEGKGKRETYKEYLEWCEDNDEKPQRKDRIFDQIMKNHNLCYGLKHIGTDANRTTTTIFYKK